MRTSFAIAATLLLIAAPALAATRGERESAPAPAPSVPGLPPFILPNPQSGNTNSGANAQSSSGGNSGGHVVTGDQTSTVTITTITNGNGTTVVTYPNNTPPPPLPADTRAPRTR